MLLMSAIVLTAATGAQPVNAGAISWEKRGVFETCLDDRLNDWVNAKAALVINEDPAAGDIDDMDVAIWSVEALQGCERQTGQTNLMSEGKFSLHMAHWRDHIHTVAQIVRQRVGAD
jgi:hypothetical protein